VLGSNVARRSFIGAYLAHLFVIGAASAQTAPAVSVPNTYHAVSNLAAYAKPARPALGAAGFRFSDPTFGSQLIRVTDANTDTRGGAFTGGSYSTPSAAHQLAWNATSDRFYVRSLSGWFIPFAFDASTLTAARIGSLLIQSHIEPQFSYQSRDILYAGWTRVVSGHDYPLIHAYDFGTSTYTELMDLRLLVTNTLDLADTYVGAISSSATAPEKVAVMFGGCCQDAHRKVAVFQSASADAAQSSVVVLDTVDSTITHGVGGTPASTIALGFRLHHALMDLSGRYVVLYPVQGLPVHFVVWDLLTEAITLVPEQARTFGHDAVGYGWQINQDCCASNTLYEGAQWQFRSLATPQVSVDLINPVPTPREIFIADHTSWNNAQPAIQVPVLSSLFRYSNGINNTTPWRAWDDEIVAIQTESAGSGARVWRFAHHRSDVSRDDGIDGTYFWYQPRGVISPNGRWALFTSNWDKGLGAMPVPDPPGNYRTDVFLVGLSAGAFTDEPLTAGVTPVKAVHITELRTRIDVLRVGAGLPTYPWTDAPLGPGMFVRAAHVIELRTALTQAYAAAVQAVPPFTDPGLGPGTIIRAVHIAELRQAVVTLEGS
jgi:hypothetical protein